VSSGIEVRPLTPDRWDDLERLFGPSGAYSGCWCMFWRISRNEFAGNGNAGNRAAFRSLTRTGPPPGLIAYVDGEPAGWISVDARERYASLERSRTLARVDDRPVWSIVCFFVAKEHRRRGLSRALIDGAVDHARSNGARIVEAYPDPRANDAASSYMGAVEPFLRAGFREVRSEPRPVLRRGVRPRRTG
jgi:GNAT superfamily N-acetyltransferase